jgi:hypothetical protein
MMQDSAESLVVTLERFFIPFPSAPHKVMLRLITEAQLTVQSEPVNVGLASGAARMNSESGNRVGRHHGA